MPEISESTFNIQTLTMYFCPTVSSDVFTFYPGSHQYQVLCPSSSQSNVHHHPRSSLPLSWKPLDPIWTTRSSAFQHTNNEVKWLLWNLNLNTRWQILQLNRLNTTIQSWTKNCYHSCSFFQLNRDTCTWHIDTPNLLLRWFPAKRPSTEVVWLLHLTWPLPWLYR